MKECFNLKVMKKLFVLSVLATAFVMSCTTMTQAGTAATKKVSKEALAEGKMLFEKSCGKCHDLPKAKDYSAEKWVGIMKSMAPKAKLDEAQSTLVYDYLTQN